MSSNEPVRDGRREVNQSRHRGDDSCRSRCSLMVVERTREKRQAAYILSSCGGRRHSSAVGVVLNPTRQYASIDGPYRQDVRSTTASSSAQFGAEVRSPCHMWRIRTRASAVERVSPNTSSTMDAYVNYLAAVRDHKGLSVYIYVRILSEKK